MKILVTGGAGFIGMHLIRRLLKEGHDVIILDNFLEQVHGSVIPMFDTEVTVIHGDVRNVIDWKLALGFNPEVIFHLAAETGTAQSMTDIYKHTSTNIDGTALLLDLINSGKYSIKRVILTSSRAVYGDGVNVESNINLCPCSTYGITKLVQEQLIELSSSVPHIIFRLQNVYGPGQSLNNPHTGIISIWYKQLSESRCIEVYDGGAPIRDFVYIDDVIDALMLGIEDDATVGEIYNVGSGVGISIKEIASLLFELVELGDIEINHKHRAGDITNACGIISKIANRLGWVPKTNIQAGLAKFVEWARLQLY